MRAKLLQTKPFMLFWMGILTGALVVGLLFLYKLYTPEMGADLFRFTPTTSVQTQGYGTPTPTLETKSYGTPQPTIDRYGYFPPQPATTR